MARLMGCCGAEGSCRICNIRCSCCGTARVAGLHIFCEEGSGEIEKGSVATAASGDGGAKDASIASRAS